MKQPKRNNEAEVLVPCLFLDSPRDHSHKYKVSRTLDTEAVFNVASAFPSRRYRLGRSLYLHPPPERTPDEERAFPLARKLSRGGSGSSSALVRALTTTPKTILGS